jgi:hypothetical protein
MGLKTFIKRIDWAYRHGFKKSTISFLGISRENYLEYVSDELFRCGHPWNRQYSTIIDNKLYLPYLFKDYPQYLPEFLFFKDCYGFMPMASVTPKVRITSKEFLEKVKQYKKVVMKAVCGEVGRGFLLLEYDAEGVQPFCVNKEHMSECQTLKLLNNLDNYIVQAYVEQHHSVAEISPSSLNTLRVLMVWNPEKNTFVVGPCFQRFGCNGNVVDNLGSGNGVLVYVDQKTGRYLDCGVINTDGRGERFVTGIRHPNTGFEFKGKDVLHFDVISRELVKIMNSVSFLKFVALDIAITEDGFRIIETNSYPDPAIAQYMGGWLKDPDIAPFFR